MRTKIVRIGNSRGIRIPRPFLDETGLEDEVEIQIEGRRIVIHPIRSPREGWANAFIEMAEAGADVPLDDVGMPTTDWDSEEWEWE